MGTVKRRAPARVGLLGNPSDGYFGKTISFSLANFSAEVTLVPSQSLRIIPHPLHDPLEFPSLASLARRTKTEGFYGGVRLLQSICTVFFDHCNRKHLKLDDSLGNFSLSYETNIPRQAGLSGSSAIICAALSCLMDHFRLADQIPPEVRPGLILAAESELGITAGLQDRVIQVYGGLLYMDFEKVHLESKGYGNYEPMDPSLLPTLHVMYADNPGESGKVHSTVRKRWLEGDKIVTRGMEEVAELAEKGRIALLRKDYALLADLMNQNFDLRRKMFGDDALGAMNIKMVELARSVGAAAKFTGSGGAVIVLCLEGPSQVSELYSTAQEEGIAVVEAFIGPSIL